MRTNTNAFVLRDAELVELLHDEPELLALSDAYEATQRHHWQRNQARRRLLRTSLIAAVATAVAVPAAAFADQIGSFLGLYNNGTPVATTALPSWQASGLAQLPEFNGGGLRKVGERDGISFYAAKNSAGGYCFAIGLSAAPSIDALKCGADTDGFPSADTPMSDFSFLDYNGGTTSVTRLAGFAASDVVRVAVVGADGTEIFSTPVVGGIYAADGVPPSAATAIVGYDASNTIVYQRVLMPRYIPKPAVP